MKEQSVSSVIGNLLMIVITIILAVAVLMLGLYYAGILVQEPFIGKLVIDQESYAPGYINATFIYSSPENLKLNAQNLGGYFSYNGTIATIIFSGTENYEGYYFHANFTKFTIFFNIENPNGKMINSSNVFIGDNSIFEFFTNSNVSLNNIEISITFKGYPGECNAYL